MADDTVKVLKIPDDIEFRVIGNLFCLLIASAGLIGGTMVNQRSFDYWLDDIVPLAFALYMTFRLFRNFLSTMALYENAPPRSRQKSRRIQPDQSSMAQLPHVPNYTPEQVVEEVARRIENQKAEAAKRAAAG